jgi:hypothetical protein
VHHASCPVVVIRDVREKPKAPVTPGPLL